MKKPLSKKAKGAIIAVALVAIIGICFTIIASYAKTLVTEGTYTPERPSVYTTEPGNEAYGAMCNIFDSAAHTDKIGTSVSVDLSVDDGSIETDLDESTLGILKYMKGSVLSSISDCYPSSDGAFALSGKLERTLRFNTDLTPYCESAVGREENGETVETDKIFFTVTPPLGEALPAPGDESYDILNIDALKASLEKIKTEYADFVEITDAKATLKSFEITGTFTSVDRTPLDCHGNAVYTVSAKLGFKGELASLGEKSIKFDYSVRENYSFKFAGIKINDDAAYVPKDCCAALSKFPEESEYIPVLFIEEGEEKALPISFTVNDGDECEAQFKSLDESLATVSEEGVVTGVKASGDATEIDITLNYLGSEYKNHIMVFVVEPVKKVLTSPSAVTLAKGETKVLTCEITPAEASVKDVLWFTEDEKVATVDKNGVVTAVGAGETKVFAVTVNGNFRSSCTVTVNEKEAN